MTNSEAKSFLRWAGSKRQLIPELSAYWQGSFNRYVEPFCGSATLFFKLAPTSAILGDINAELIETYSQVRKSPLSIAETLKKLRKGRTRYLELRALDPGKMDPAMRAARFIYLNRYCFNGLYRTNLAGRFNVPYGGDRSGNLPSLQELEACASLLQRAKLIAGGFEKTLNMVKRGDFVYMDPPFNVRSKRVFREYNPSAFGSATLEILRQWLERLDRLGATFLVSYAESDEANALAKSFNTKLVTVKRNISGFVEGRVAANELLITNRAS